MQKTNKQQKKQYNFYYSFLTMILLAVAVYTAYSGINNIVKLISFHHKTKVVEQAYMKAAINKQALLVMLEQTEAEIQEEIKRNKLKWIPEDELMVDIVPKEEEAKEEIYIKNVKFANMY